MKYASLCIDGEFIKLANEKNKEKQHIGTVDNNVLKNPIKIAKDELKK